MSSGSRKKYLLTGSITFSLAFISAYIASAGFMSPGSSDASTSIHASISSDDYYINVSSLGEVNINANATRDGAEASANDTVTVKTNTKGYKLYLSSNSDTTNSNRMYLNGDTSSAYYLSPTSGSGGGSNLSTNSWGYSMDNGSSYNPVPLKGNEVEIVDNWNKLTAGTDTTNNHTVTYGVKADLAIPAGDYTSTVAYSVIAEANAVSNIASISPTTMERADTGTFTLTITIPMLTNMEYGDWTVKLTNITDSSTSSDCTNVTKTKVDNKLKLTCTVPKNTASGSYTVEASSTKYGTYTSSTNFTFTETRNIFSITNMQQMDRGICSNTMTPSADAIEYDTDGTHTTSTSYIPQTVLTDTRDNKKYVIQKMPDGRCWMVQNLAINPGVLSAEKTNVTSDYTLPDNDKFNEGGNTTQAMKIGSHTDGDTSSTGNWYSFNAATAGTGSAATEDGDNATEDICPKNWRLPYGGTADSEFQTLYSFYNDKPKFNGLWHTKYVGFYNNSGLTYSSTATGWRSRTAITSYQAYDMYIDAGVNMSPVNYHNMNFGFSIRCIAE